MRILVMALAIWMVICGAATAETVELKSGEKLEGAILDRNDDFVEMEHAVLGRIKIPTDEIKPPDGPKTRPGLFGTSFLEGWNKALSAGFSGSSGKSKDLNANADLELRREIERHRSNFVARYYFAESNKEKSANQFDTRYAHDFLFPSSDFFPFLIGHYRWDEFQEWDHRVGGDGGVGYQMFRNESFDVLGRFGGGVSRTIGGDDERTEYTGLAGLETQWVIMEGMSLDWDTYYYPDFGDLPNFRLESRAELKLAVGVIEGLGFKLGGAYIYDGHETDFTRNERKYYGNLVYDF